MTQTPDAEPIPPVDELERLRLAADFELLPRAASVPRVGGAIRRRPEDFMVVEKLPFELSGDGEHLYLRVRKTGQNTRWVAKRLAAAAGVSQAAVGYAGMKDRHAVAEQWFSLHLPGQPDPDDVCIEGVEILERVRHNAKLRTGAVAANDFRIVVTDLGGDVDAMLARLPELRVAGVPNYFGPQRFGRDAGTLDLLSNPRKLNRETRALGLSALRAALFNGYLAMRLTDGSWRTLLDGEIPARGDGLGETSGLLWGTGDNRATAAALAREEMWFTMFPGCLAVLDHYRPRMMRRALAVTPRGLSCETASGRAEISFTLPKGAYATMVLRELGEFSVAEAD